MARHSRRKEPPPLPRIRLAAPAALIAAALILAIMTRFGLATAFLIAGLGALLLVYGKHRRWQGAPEAGYLLVGVGAIIALLAIFS